MPRSIPNQDHLKFGDPSTWIPLFDILIDPDPLYLTPNRDAIYTDNHTYLQFPIILDEVQQDGKGEVSTVTLTASFIDGVLPQKIKDGLDVEGVPIIFKVYSVAQDCVVYEEYLEIIAVKAITTQTVTFDVGMFNPFMAKLLTERFLSDFCWNTYKGAGCYLTRWYDGTFVAHSEFVAGSPDTCNQKLIDCTRHMNVARFRSYPGIPGAGGFV